MIIFPAIDIIAGRTVRLEKGRYDKETSYPPGPLEAAREWVGSGCRWLHVIDLDGAKAGRPVNRDLITNIARETGVPVQTGGGYRTVDDIRISLEAGIERVIVGSSAAEDIEMAGRLIRDFDDRVLISCDAEAFDIKTRGWLSSDDKDLFEYLSALRDLGAERIIYTDIRRDGTLTGPSVENIEIILERTGLKVIYAGGVSKLDDLVSLKALVPKGLEGVIIGRALYEGAIDLKEALSVSEKDNPLS